ncbi:CU044_5270 family protein [Actinomadura rugatobispora]|uniref:CU044_5270 family protein n=1 Tax=Actinomadura rugatobispora TaxID=1994 RepID=A0ABW1AJL3_9ACTN|nr:CU044_5270 family protein [Actinomadura rugatobispora]
MSDRDDIMDRIAGTRPASLTPPHDPSRRDRDLARAMTAAVPGPSRTGRGGRSARRAPRWAALGTGLTAAAAAAIVAISGLGTGTPAGPPSAPPTKAGQPGASVEALQQMSSRQVLLMAATAAERKPATDGAYWKVSHIRQNHAGRSLEVDWKGKDGAYWSGHLWLGGPRKPAGERGWLTRGPRSNRFSVVDQPLTLKEIRGLPTTPEGIERWARKVASGVSPNWRKVDIEGFVDTLLTYLLVQVPALPATRAAAFRALADRPGVRDGGVARDQRGRPGRELRLGKDGQERVLVDPATSQLLSIRTVLPRHPEFSETYLEVGWTDEKPRVPTAP